MLIREDSVGAVLRELIRQEIFVAVISCFPLFTYLSESRAEAPAFFLFINSCIPNTQKSAWSIAGAQ